MSTTAIFAPGEERDGFTSSSSTCTPSRNTDRTIAVGYVCAKKKSKRTLITCGSLLRPDVNDALGFRIGSQPVRRPAAIRITLEIVGGFLQNGLQKIYLLH